MAPSSKARAAGVSASSFFDLKAELAKQEEEARKNKSAGKSTLVGGVKRPDKKPTVWARPNKGVHDRAQRDVELEIASKRTFDTAKAALERKAQIYEKLKRGKSGGLSDAQYDALLVDFDAKGGDVYESDSDDVDESLTVPKPPGGEDSDPIVEYEDEFGRLRTGRRSEIPRHLLKDEKEEEDIDPFVIYNPEGHFPIYEPSEERKAEIAAKFSEENNPLNVHYDAAREVRAKGGAFYQFSGDEEMRQKQMEELKHARDETAQTREDLGAVDLAPGEVEGMVAPSEAEDGPALKRSRALEKRKREIEDRRKLLDAKRRKKDPAASSGASSSVATPQQEATPPPPPRPASSPSPGPPPPPPSATHAKGRDRSPTPEYTVAYMPPLEGVVDPFAALEAQTVSKNGKGKQKAAAAPLSADAFLASLEADIMKGHK